MNKNTQNKPFLKTELGMYYDLCDYIDILKIGLNNINNKNSWAKYKILLFSLRVLICDQNFNGDLIGRFLKIIGYIPELHFPGMRGIPKSNPLSKSKDKTYFEYIEGTQLHTPLKEYSTKNFISGISRLTI